ncbi:MAG: hypothetical protein PHU29_09890 [Sulfuricurvum sp.]|nr:hypothetical protein [Sulfuricurvum sp.]MDD2951087.1 hypothetical protein [Sulfuricurvum sp.]MDD5118671.1 hypothetical protein [Sulfuricurvum sp.]
MKSFSLIAPLMIAAMTKHSQIPTLFITIFSISLNPSLELEWRA